MNRRRRIGMLAFFGLIGLGAWSWASTREPFLHAPHERMFPACESCHELQPDGMTMPDASFCSACHNGQTVRRVEWDGPTRRPSSLNFDHAGVMETKQEALGFELPCQTCHVPSGGERMDITRAVVESCLGCHASGKDHQIDAPCAKCHVTLAEAEEFTVAQLRERPAPSDHGNDFVFQHGELAAADITRCSVCHARDTCSRCHVNAASVPAIQALAPDPRIAEIVSGREVVYPTPASHTETGWWETHDDRARADVSTCATCHTRTSCETCHVDPVPEPVRRLSSGRNGADDRDAPAENGAGTVTVPQQQAPGVTLTRRAPASHGITFADDHRAPAASATAQCRTCHVRDECTSCHTGSEALTTPGQSTAQYHPVNFLQQHSAPAFGREVECASCHNPEAFCRDCHAGSGLSAAGRTDTGFHDRKPLWRFGHGKAARQTLESCVACHAQSDCLSCHSSLSGRGVNPHGPGFDARRLGAKAPATCLRCHASAILNR